MARIMCQESDGKITHIPEGKKGQMLAGDGWKELNAKSLPYTSPDSGSLENVSVALDYLLRRYSEVATSVTAALSSSQRSEAESDATIAVLKNALAAMEQQFNDAVASVRQSNHASVDLSKVSNPALHLNSISQTLWLDLSEPGSFDDSGAKIGSNSVQGAISRLALLLGDLRNDYYRVYNEAVTLANRLEETERRLTILEKGKEQG